jgi:hypothetical protein
MDALHSRGAVDSANGWTVGRYRFFMIIAGCTFVWQWIPNAIAPFLSYLGQFPTWIAPNNVAVNQVRPQDILPLTTYRFSDVTSSGLWWPQRHGIPSGNP